MLSEMGYFILFVYCFSNRYRDGLRAGRLGFDSRQGKDIFLFRSVQIGSGAHLAEYLMGSGDSFLGDNLQGREADYSPPSGAEIKNGRVISPVSHTSSWRGA
jgi:hypothetical protein